MASHSTYNPPHAAGISDSRISAVISMSVTLNFPFPSLFALISTYITYLPSSRSMQLPHMLFRELLTLNWRIRICHFVK